ncbi:D-alanyl-D-alanine carboxypeptidase [Deinococcus sp. YIM 134068]|uniref:D-alanyl-D-alanine carboxypeptidase/D-alanyl-D-alanine-endopeptidase n=1 Tax=Deinococcus lichenicola TaxID=3118910 RepID=UPI002F9298FE
MRRLLPLCLALLAPWSGAQAPPAAPPVREPGLSAGVRRVVDGLPPGVRAGVLVRDLTTGRVLESRNADQPFIPASNRKLIVAASALLDRGGAGGWWSTELTVPAREVGRARVSHLTLRGSADPTLSIADGPNSLRALARQVHGRGVREVGAVLLDESTLDASTWDGLLLGVPMTPVRLAEWHNNTPTSAAEARERVGAALVAELRRAGVRVRSEGMGTARPFLPYRPPSRTDERGQALPPDPVVPLNRRPEQGVATVRSGSPRSFLYAMLRPSDNLRSEELLATLAVRPAGNGALAGALARERAALRRLGVDLTHIRLADGSGLSRENRVTPRALVGLLRAVHDLPYPTAGALRAESPGQTYRARRNLFVEALPQAGTGAYLPGYAGRGGTLAGRLVGSGLDVRAKTGTLPGVSALSGYVTGRSGHTLAFSLLMNGPENTFNRALRAAQDEIVRAVAAAY